VRGQGRRLHEYVGTSLRCRRGREIKWIHHLMKLGRNLGKKVGSRQTSTLDCQALKTNPSKPGVQRALHCRCGREKILALGLCATCYTLKRQDEEYFGGLREQVLERDGYCCRVCGASGRRKRSIVVHHRVPGRSVLHLMISLCPVCHVKVGRTKAVLSQMPALLLELWREQHPLGHEQTALNFKANFPAAKSAPLFLDRLTGSRQTNSL
jgi:5-methylcytosine-specific restriction endonuclease McrA